MSLVPVESISSGCANSLPGSSLVMSVNADRMVASPTGCSKHPNRLRPRRASVLLFLKSVAERMRRVDTQYRQFLGEEGKLFQRKHERSIVRMALNVRVELRGEEVAADHIAFELRHIHAVGRKAAERFVKCGRHIPDSVHKGRNDFASARLCPFFLSRQDDETRRGM